MIHTLTSKQCLSQSYFSFKVSLSNWFSPGIWRSNQNIEEIKETSQNTHGHGQIMQNMQFSRILWTLLYWNPNWRINLYWMWDAKYATYAKTVQTLRCWNYSGRWVGKCQISIFNNVPFISCSAWGADPIKSKRPREKCHLGTLCVFFLLTIALRICTIWLHSTPKKLKWYLPGWGFSLQVAVCHISTQGGWNSTRGDRQHIKFHFTRLRRRVCVKRWPTFWPF